MKAWQQRWRGGALSVLVALMLIPLGSVEAEESATSAQVWSLQEVVDQARANPPLEREQQAHEDYARARQSRAERARWPRLRAESQLAPVPANADPSRLDENIDEITGLNFGPYFRQTARITQPLYTFGRVSLNQQLAQVGVDVAILENQQEMQRHLSRAQRAYFGRQLATAFEEILEEGRELVKDTLEEMEEERAFGTAEFDTEDLRRVQIFDAELDAMVLENRRLKDLTGSALAYLMDTDESVEVAALRPGDADKPLGTLEDYRQAARVHRPEVQMLGKGVEARELEARLERREYLPNLYAAMEFGFGWSTEEPALQPICRQPDPEGDCVFDDTLFARPYSNPFDTLSLGVVVGLRWDLDFGQDRGRERQAFAELDKMEAQRERAMGAMMLEIEEAWREASDAEERIQIERRRYDAARRWRNQRGLQADFGHQEDMEELIDPLTSYYEARIQYLEAAHAYLVARIDLANAVGLDDLEQLELALD